MNGMRFCKYKTSALGGKEILPVVKEFNQGGKETLPGVVKKFNQGGKEILPNNKDNNKLPDNKEIIKDIVFYLNEKAGTNFRHTSENTRSHINARLNEGFTLEQFKIVIDKKCAEWLGTEFEQYLRPATLFGTKFEGYLNAPVRAKAPTKTVGANGIAIENKPSELDGIL
jgi:uncharacterized phage protein (TIGR02220 family)